MRCHAIPTFGTAEAGCFLAVHSAWKERWVARLDDIGCILRLKMKAPLGTSMKTSLVSRNHGMIPSYTVFQGCSKQSKIAALQNGHFGLKLHRNNDLVTVVEVMPSIIEQACVRMVRHFGWEDDQGGDFCKPRLKLNPFDLAKVWQICFADFFDVPAPYHCISLPDSKVVRAKVGFKVAVTFGMVCSNLEYCMMYRSQG